MGDDTFQPSGTAVATDGPRSRALDEDIPAMRATDGPNPSTAEHDADGVLKSLTPRERQVAAVVAAGLSNQRAAAALSMATKTVECHLGRIYRKLGVTSRVQLAVAIGLQASPDPEARWPSLSSSEQQIVVLIGFGMTTRLAANHLYLSPKTIEYHLGRIYRKLQITSRRQLLDVIVTANAPRHLVAIPETAA
jgi:DNA-binding NarL/FixJ family response regulator